MQELILTDLDEQLVNGLYQRANRHGRTVVEEATAILTHAVRNDRPVDWSPVDAIHDRLVASGRNFTDSASLLREDRDR